MSRARRPLRIGALLLASTLGAAVVPALATTGVLFSAHAGDGDVPTPPAPPNNRAIRVATFNTESPLSVEKGVSDFTSLVKRYHPDIITLQEFANPEKHRLIREQYVDCADCPYDVYMPPPATAASTPIFYRSSRFQLVSAESVQVTKPTYVGRRGAGPSTIRAKYVNHVVLRDLASGRLINVLNNHAVPSVQGKDGGPNPRMAKRVRLYSQHMAGLVAMIQQVKATTGGTVLVTGDLNVNFRRDKVLQPVQFPYYNMSSVNLEAGYDWLGMPAWGTHVLGNGNDTRLIDYVYVKQRAFTTPLKQEIALGLHSDHRPLIVTLKITPTDKLTPQPTDPPTEPPTDPPTN